ncbi:MAG TPA: hypothetical protein VM452_05800 [Caulifigura sp.]|nr:hypothetical protein [Caulifigura sp.]
MRRLATLLLIAGWITSVTWYWWHNVPLAATKSIRLPPGSKPYHPMTDDLLPVARVRWENGPGSRVITHGPVDFWSFPDCRKTRSLYSADDEILVVSQDRPEVLIRRSGRLVVTSSETGAELAVIPDVSDVTTFVWIPESRAVLVADRKDIFLYEVGQDAPKWVLPMSYFGGEIANGLLIVSPRRPNEADSIQSIAMAVDLETGKPDGRFDHLSVARIIRFSPDGTLAIVQTNPVRVGPKFRPGSVQTPGRTVVCNAETGEVIWTVPTVEWSNPATFAANGPEIHARRRKPDGEVDIGRWVANRGVPLPDLKVDEKTPLRASSFDGRYAYFHAGNENTASVRFRHRLYNLAGSYGLGRFLPPLIFEPKLRDTTTGEIAGSLSRGVPHAFLQTQNGVVSYNSDFIRFYALPPHRDYLWLAAWLIIPPALLAGLWRLVRFIRDRRALRRMAGAA